MRDSENHFKSKIKSDMPLYIALFLINAAWLCIFLQMMPLGDDWGYYTTPLGLGINFTRFFDGLIGVLLTSFPSLFPWFNRVLLAVLHFVNCITFYKFALNVLKQNKQYSRLFTVLFSISPWIYASIAQTDAMNNLLAFTPGIIGAYLYFKTENETRGNIYYIVFSILSLCGKESGAAFIAVIPATILIRVIHGELSINTAINRIFRSYLLGIILFLIYFRITFGIRTSDSASRSLRGLLSAIAFPFFSFTGVNTFDVYNGFWINTIIGVILSAPLLVFAFANFCKLAKNKDKLALIAILLFIFGELFLLPIQLFSSVTDMHIYLVAFFTLLIILYFLPKDKKRLAGILMSLCFISFIISDCEKLYWQNISSGYVREFQSEAFSLIGEAPKKLHIISPGFDIDKMTYRYPGIADGQFASNSNGRSLYPVYGYDKPINIIKYDLDDNIEEILKTIPEDHTILIVYPDKALKIVNN